MDLRGYFQYVLRDVGNELLDYNSDTSQVYHPELAFVCATKAFTPLKKQTFELNRIMSGDDNYKMRHTSKNYCEIIIMNCDINHFTRYDEIFT